MVNTYAYLVQGIYECLYTFLCTSLSVPNFFFEAVTLSKSFISTLIFKRSFDHLFYTLFNISQFYCLFYLKKNYF